MEYISSDQIKYRKPDIDDFLVTYNELLAKVLVENFNSFKYQTSATINRLEAQTHFYEYVEKYIQIIELLDVDPALCVMISKNDQILYGPLKQRYGTRISGDYGYTDGLKRKFILKLTFHIFIELILLIGSRILFKPKNKYDYIIRTYFDFRCIHQKTGAIRDDYFDRFLEDLKVIADVLVVFKLLNWRYLGKFIRAKKKVGFDVCLLESFLLPSDLCKAFFSYIKSRIRLKTPLIYKGHDISRLMNLSLEEDYYKLRGLTFYLEYYVAKRILKLSPDRLFYPFENQTWEKVYSLAKKRDNFHTVIVGFQHTGFSYKLLNHFPTRIEKHLPIFPDIILTTGQIFKRLLTENAHFPSVIKVGAALRHDKFVTNGGFTFKDPVNKVLGRIAYAFSSDIEKHFRIVNLLLDVFEYTDITVYLKFHPLFDQKLILKRLNRHLPANFLPASNIPWQDIYNSVDAILYDDNSLSIEGIFNGVKTYMLDEEEPIYNIERMFGFNEWDRSLDKKGLIELKQALQGRIFDKTYNVENVKNYVKEYFSEYSIETAFHRFIS
jgi:hypothetical protein